MRRWGALLLVTGLVGAGACEQDGNGGMTGVDSNGIVRGLLFQDLNGTGQPDLGDDGVEGWPLRLRQPAGGVLATATSDTAGVFEFGEVPAGRVVLTVDAALLGDTLELLGVAYEPFDLGRDQTVDLRPGVRFLTYEPVDARGLAPGRPLFSYGIALNALSSNVRTLHIRGLDGTPLRIVGFAGGLIQPGDSVRVRGRTARELGQPILEQGAVFTLRVALEAPEAVVATTGDASLARGGELDSDLVEVRDADVLEVDDEDEDGIRVLVDDGSGPLEIRYREFLAQNPDEIVPDSVVVERARGLLVPYDDGGETRWRLLPRTRSDVRLEDVVFPPGGD
jgi:hypothetical protein